MKTKILTISEPDCGGKPTGYAVTILNSNRNTLKTAVCKGLIKGWYYSEGMADTAIGEAELDALKENGYCWLGERFLVEVTIMDEETPLVPFAKMHITANVNWDYDDGDTPPDRLFEVTFTAQELVENVMALDNTDDDCWYLDEDKLDSYMSDYVTNFTDFCHNGLTYTYVTE